MNPELMVEEGDRYYNGSDGYPRDAHKALEYYRKAAECKYHWGYFNVGKCYREGQGVDKNDDEARKWFREAERVAGNPWATYWIALMGDSDAAFRMAEYFATGSHAEWGVPRDKRKAEHFRNFGLWELVKKGDRYYNGADGYPRDAHKALEYYRKAAECEYHWGYYNVGICYLEGQGVAKNDDEARKWFRKAERVGGNPWATYWLALMGDSAAALRMAGYYATGGYAEWGVPRNESVAAYFRSLGRPEDAYSYPDNGVALRNWESEAPDIKVSPYFIFEGKYPLEKLATVVGFEPAVLK